MGQPRRLARALARAHGNQARMCAGQQSPTVHARKTHGTQVRMPATHARVARTRLNRTLIIDPTSTEEDMEPGALRLRPGGIAISLVVVDVGVTLQSQQTPEVNMSANSPATQSTSSLVRDYPKGCVKVAMVAHYSTKPPIVA